MCVFSIPYNIRQLPLEIVDMICYAVSRTYKRVSYNGNTPVFQTGARSSILLTRSQKYKHLLILGGVYISEGKRTNYFVRGGESKRAALREFKRSERRAPRAAACETFPSGNVLVGDSLPAQ